jgi:hypothetical protein
VRGRRCPQALRAKGRRPPSPPPRPGPPRACMLTDASMDTSSPLKSRLSVMVASPGALVSVNGAGGPLATASGCSYVVCSCCSSRASSDCRLSDSAPPEVEKPAAAARENGAPPARTPAAAASAAPPAAAGAAAAAAALSASAGASSCCWAAGPPLTRASAARARSAAIGWEPDQARRVGRCGRARWCGAVATMPSRGRAAREGADARGPVPLPAWWAFPPAARRLPIPLTPRAVP